MRERRSLDLAVEDNQRLVQCGLGYIEFDIKQVSRWLFGRANQLVESLFRTESTFLEKERYALADVDGVPSTCVDTRTMGKMPMPRREIFAPLLEIGPPGR